MLRLRAMRGASRHRTEGELKVPLPARQRGGGPAAKEASDSRQKCSEGVLELGATRCGVSRRSGVGPVESTRLFGRCRSSRKTSIGWPRPERRCGGIPTLESTLRRQWVRVDSRIRGTLVSTSAPRSGGFTAGTGSPGLVLLSRGDTTGDWGSRVCLRVVLCCTSRQTAPGRKYPYLNLWGGRSSRREDPH